MEIIFLAFFFFIFIFLLFILILNILLSFNKKTYNYFGDIMISDCVKVKIEQHQIIDDIDDKMFFDGKAIFKNNYVQVWLLDKNKLVNYLLVKKIDNKAFNLYFHQNKTQLLLKVGVPSMFDYQTKEGSLMLETTLIEGILHNEQLYLKYQLSNNKQMISINTLLINSCK